MLAKNFDLTGAEPGRGMITADVCGPTPGCSYLHTDGTDAARPFSPVAGRLIEAMDPVSLQRHFTQEWTNKAPPVELVADYTNIDNLPSRDALREFRADCPNRLPYVPVVWSAANADTAHVIRPANIWFARNELGNPFVCRNVPDEGLPSISDRHHGVPRTVDQELIGNLVERADYPTSLLGDQAISDLDGDAVTSEGQDKCQAPSRCGSFANGGLPWFLRNRSMSSASTSTGNRPGVSFQATRRRSTAGNCQIRRPPQCPTGLPAPKSAY